MDQCRIAENGRHSLYQKKSAQRGVSGSYVCFRPQHCHNMRRTRWTSSNSLSGTCPISCLIWAYKNATAYMLTMFPRSFPPTQATSEPFRGGYTPGPALNLFMLGSIVFTLKPTSITMKIPIRVPRAAPTNAKKTNRRSRSCRQCMDVSQPLGRFNHLYIYIYNYNIFHTSIYIYIYIDR